MVKQLCYLLSDSGARAVTVTMAEVLSFSPSITPLLTSPHCGVIHHVLSLPTTHTSPHTKHVNTQHNLTQTLTHIAPSMLKNASNNTIFVLHEKDSSDTTTQKMKA